MQKNWLFPPIAVILALVLTVAPALAHNMNIFARVIAAGIEGEVYFSGGGNPQNIKVFAKNDQGSIIVEGKTDTDGKFLIPKEHIQGLKGRAITITADAMDGHRAYFTMIIPEIEVDGATQQQPKPTPAKRPAPTFSNFFEPLLLLIAIFGLLFWIKSGRKKLDN